jgi:TPR repeat protein
MRVVVLGVLLAVLLVIMGARHAEAACSRACPVAQRDERGCCPVKKPAAARKPLVSKPAGIKIGKLAPQCRAVTGCHAACEAGDLPACRRLGELLWYGLGDGQRDDAARRYERACDGKKATVGCAGLARAYDRGVGVMLDNVKAAELYARACKAGDGGGCAGLAEMQLAGQVKPGPGEPAALLTRAAKLLADACKKNVDLACVQLAELHTVKGGLVPEAKAWKAALRRAEAYAAARCSADYTDACVIKERLGAGLDGAEGTASTSSIASLGLLCDKGLALACRGVTEVLIDGRETGSALVELAVKRGCDQLGDPGVCLFKAQRHLQGEHNTGARQG